MDITTIILAIITAISGLISGVAVGSRKRKQDANATMIENVQAAIKIWQSSAEVLSVRNEILTKQLIKKDEELIQAYNRMAEASNAAKLCPHADTCPIDWKFDSKLQKPTSTRVVRTDSNRDGKGTRKGYHDSVASRQGDATGATGV